MLDLRAYIILESFPNSNRRLEIVVVDTCYAIKCFNTAWHPGTLTSTTSY